MPSRKLPLWPTLFLASRNANVRPLLVPSSHSTTPLNCDGHELPLLAVQTTELADRMFILGFAYNHALCNRDVLVGLPQGMDTLSTLNQPSIRLIVPREFWAYYKRIPCGISPPHPINIKGHGRLRVSNRSNNTTFIFLFFIALTFPIY